MVEGFAAGIVSSKICSRREAFETSVTNERGESTDCKDKAITSSREVRALKLTTDRETTPPVDGKSHTMQVMEIELSTVVNDTATFVCAIENCRSTGPGLPAAPETSITRRSVAETSVTERGVPSRYASMSEAEVASELRT